MFQIMVAKIPIIYVYLYSKIKEKNKGDLIRTKHLKSILQNSIIMKEGLGGDRKGIPKIYIYEIISDMRDFCLLKRLNHKQFKILKSNCEKKLKNFPY